MSGQDKQEHGISINQRRELCVTGVKDVDSFDESGAVLQTTEGELTVEGEELKVGVLDIDKGIVTISGRIDGVLYTRDTPEPKRGLMSRIFK